MTIDQIKDANKAAGYHFFSPDSLRFFGSRVLPTVYAGNVFITSEYTNWDRSDRAYTVRRLESDGTIETVGEFLGYATRAEAVKVARAAGTSDLCAECASAQ